jgi:predicted phage terminase large subunit-like protein
MAGPDADGVFYVVDVVRGQWDATERNRIIRRTGVQDGVEVRVGIPQDPGAAGKEVVASLKRLLAGYAVYDETETGSKEVRADPLAAQVGAGNVALVRASWNSNLVEEFRSFPLGKNDDQVDAAARAFNKLAKKRELKVFV